MSFLVTKRAEPHDFQRLGVVGMVRVYSASLAAIRACTWSHQSTGLERVSNNPVSTHLLRIFSDPLSEESINVFLASPSELAIRAKSHLSNLLSVVFSIAAVTFAYLILVGLAICSLLFANFADLPLVVLAVVFGAGFLVFNGHAGTVSQFSSLKEMFLTGDYLGQ
jgi:hypothetical protein